MRGSEHIGYERSENCPVDGGEVRIPNDPAGARSTSNIPVEQKTRHPTGNNPDHYFDHLFIPLYSLNPLLHDQVSG